MNVISVSLIRKQIIVSLKILHYYVQNLSLLTLSSHRNELVNAVVETRSQRNLMKTENGGAFQNVRTYYTGSVIRSGTYHGIESPHIGNEIDSYFQ